MMKVSLLLEAINRASGPIRAVEASLAALRRAGAGTAAPVVAGLSSIRAAAAATAGGIRGAAIAAGSRVMAMNDFVVDATHHFKTLAGPEGIERASRSIGYLRGQVSGLSTGFSILKYASAAAVIGLGGEFARGVFKAGDETRSMLVTLSRLEGGAANARRAMAWMQNFGMGAGSLFSMPDIFKGYQMATNFGFDPQKNLRSFADLAAGESKSLYVVLRAIQDATAGTSMKPLKNLGIDVTQGKGSDATDRYEWDQNKVKHSMTSAKGRVPVLNAILKIIDMKYGGIASGKAELLGGQLQALKNKLFAFQTTVANAGVYDWATGQLGRLFAYFDRASKSGALDALAKRISGFITGAGDMLIRFFVATDWNAVGRDLAALGGIIATLAGGLGLLAQLGGGGLSGLMNIFIASKIIGITSAIAGLVPVIVTLGTVLFGLDIAAAPVTAIVVAIGALVAVGYLLWANWSRVSGWWSGLWGGLSTTTKVAIATLGVVTFPMLAIPALIIAYWSPIRDFFTKLWHDIGSWQPPAWMRVLAGVGLLGSGNVAGALAAALPAPVPKPGPARLTPAERAGADRLSQGPRGASQLTIDFKNPPPGMRVRELRAAPGHQIDVKRGPIQVAH